MRKTGVGGGACDSHIEGEHTGIGEEQCRVMCVGGVFRKKYFNFNKCGNYHSNETLKLEQPLEPKPFSIFDPVTTSCLPSPFYE